jgi:hypothetical protein
VSEITICCCLWGEFPDSGWSTEYVRRLRDGVSRNLPMTHRFVCFADREFYIDGIEVRLMKPPSWFGNLPKTYVYSPEAELKGRVILFDLDNVIVGDLSDMAAYDGPLCVRGRLQHGIRPQPDGDMISFDASNVKHLWDYARSPNIVKKTDGREREFILQADPHCDIWQEVCPGQVVSYRHHCRSVGLPKNARVVSCHGKPRPHEIGDEFIKRHWR